MPDIWDPVYLTGSPVCDAVLGPPGLSSSPRLYTYARGHFADIFHYLSLDRQLMAFSATPCL